MSGLDLVLAHSTRSSSLGFRVERFRGSTWGTLDEAKLHALLLPSRARDDGGEVCAVALRPLRTILAHVGCGVQDVLVALARLALLQARAQAPVDALVPRLPTIAHHGSVRPRLPHRAWGSRDELAVDTFRSDRAGCALDVRVVVVGYVLLALALLACPQHARAHLDLGQSLSRLAWGALDVDALGERRDGLDGVADDGEQDLHCGRPDLTPAQHSLELRCLDLCLAGPEEEEHVGLEGGGFGASGVGARAD
eukprot:449419-Rhodomonas_salina.2